MRRARAFITLAALAAAWGCGGKSAEAPAAPKSGAAAPAAQGAPPQARTTATGTLTADPNPIQVCDGSGLGVTTVTGSYDGTAAAAIHVDAPDGPLFAGGMGSSRTHKWVHDATVFYLQDVADGRPLTVENTIAKVTVKVTSEGCR